jgi:hypothetical protein
LEQLQGQLGIPLPGATQWEVVEEAAGLLKPARDELIRQAAQGDVQVPKYLDNKVARRQSRTHARNELSEPKEAPSHSRNSARFHRIFLCNLAPSTASQRV